eukprot:TRINITY_DN27433_c0_g2_i1.p1 TRINITY_DN27433_c0_g2~~TRINITY_DN27433_c0_g2_i1.p1  ORF type:complete len:569 (+),score=47.66 TRINITY_DN27433_c0_g2_i1:160-1866(+)
MANEVCSPPILSQNIRSFCARSRSSQGATASDASHISIAPKVASNSLLLGVVARCGFTVGFGYCCWLDLLRFSACCASHWWTRELFDSLRRGAFACPVRELPKANHSLRWLATRLADGRGGGIEVLKLSDIACHHSDEGAIIVASVCKTIRSLHFHSKEHPVRDDRRCAGGCYLTSRGLSAVLGGERPLLRRVVLHGSAVTDHALLLLATGCPSLESVWLSCATCVTGPGLLACAQQRLSDWRDIRFDALCGAPEELLIAAREASGHFQAMRCLLLADCSASLATTLQPTHVNGWTNLLRLGLLFSVNGLVCFCEKTIVSLATLCHSQLRALALANVHVGDAFPVALAGCVECARRLPHQSGNPRSRDGQPMALRALCVDGIHHGISGKSLRELLQSTCTDVDRAASGRFTDSACLGGVGVPRHNGLDELMLTAAAGCEVVDATLLEWMSLGIKFVSVDGADISWEGVRVSGLRALRAKACPRLKMPQEVRMASPAGNRMVSCEMKTKSAGFSPILDVSRDSFKASRPSPTVRLLEADQSLCYWWCKGYYYDELSWYGLEHLDEPILT